MLIKQFVRKNAFNGEVFLGKLFQEKANARDFTEPRRSLWISNIHNWMEQKVLNFKLFAWVHMLNEGGLYKMDKTNIINELQFYYITRWHS